MEIVLWMPFFLLLVFLTVDASLLYWRHGEMWNIARDVARTIASGSLDGTDNAAVQAFLTDRLGITEATVQTAPTLDGQGIIVRVERNPDFLTTFSIFSNLIGGDIAAEVVFRVEP
ncbi:pilus assembly protein [Limibaculum sp. FT325]|uniref:TadE/TadG family type IV pilus assembly protein n=1 Tax=Thermohalobaculum sediminis TaxID=2939436 RepID=UPI0020BE0BC3|nr:TadE family protein [Limibaculum sediminis]MCL5777125.1 pilus assembly protein [Limibaculum sediminis]